MKDYPIRMTSGQTFFVTLCFLLVSFITFYLGARFGPEIFWNIQVDRINQETLLPSETSEQELALLLKEETVPAVTFHDELQKKVLTFGPLDNSKSQNIPLLVSGPAENNNMVLKETETMATSPKSDTKEKVSVNVISKETARESNPKQVPKQLVVNLEKPKKIESSIMPSTNKPVVQKTLVVTKPETSPKQNPPADQIQKQIDHEVNW